MNQLTTCSRTSETTLRRKTGRIVRLKQAIIASRSWLTGSFQADITRKQGLEVTIQIKIDRKVFGQRQANIGQKID